MENISEYINVFIQAPVAVILMYFMHRMMVNQQQFIQEVLKILKQEKRKVD